MTFYPWDQTMINTIYFTKNHRSVATGMIWTDQQTQQMCLLANRAAPIVCNIISRDENLKQTVIKVVNFSIDDNGDLCGNITPIESTNGEEGISKLVFLMSFTRTQTDDDGDDDDDAQIVLTGINAIDILQ